MKIQTFTNRQFLTVPVIAGFLLFSSCSKDDALAQNEGMVTTDSDTKVYKDGSYNARGYYGGVPSYITVDLQLQNQIITGVVVTPMPNNNPTSAGYQQSFAAAVPAVAVGKPISEVKVGRLAGSSGTNIGFNNAIDQIKNQAAR